MIERDVITYQMLVGELRVSIYRPFIEETALRVTIATKQYGISRAVPIQPDRTRRLTTSCLMRLAVIDEIGIAEHKEDAPLVAFLKEAEELLNEKEVCDFVNAAVAALIGDVAYSKEREFDDAPAVPSS